MAEWRFWLANSDDMSEIGLLPASQKSITFQMNNPGHASFSVPANANIAQYIESNKTCIIARRNGVIRWSGFISGVRDEAPGNVVSCTASGWYELLNHRLINPTQAATMNYTTIDAGTIASNLLAAANAIYPTGITIGTVEASIARTRKYENFQNIGQEINNLSVVENGFDYEINPATRQLNIYYPMGETQTNATFGYNALPNNLSSFTRQEDGLNMINKIFVQGRNTYAVVPPGTPTTATDYGLFEDMQSLTEVTEASILLAYGGSEVIIKERPIVVYSITPKKDTVPRPFDHYYLGDTLSFSVKTPRITVNEQAVRVYGFTVEIDNSGVETVTQLQTTL
jgi:hypothetical protein